ncbi:uncharacterized protein CTHT_0045120 [Thermochaetoides thermophila DSM 1495]|uniref:SWR1-complex protein 4 n=1 Tax=Chaetomium thermophilum (strain DSM 1495 / CBS 144.50 / IMI 039719) TaxID=759272 RepID=G0S9A4_CHATD|nr:hypothetical protein CTHT_0045120 [Thermochaetoides thermophila DSM 1495]EGS20015.1 hypothetical protein CTHT_0045120 [Thermochaetoides thermophila DSM 1495]
MTSNDVRDVLNLPSDASVPRPSRKQKPTAPRPNLKGLAREVQNLGGDTPIAIVPEISFKKRRFASRKPAARWVLKPFTNSARNDGGALVLRHWRRKTPLDGAPPPDHTPESESLAGEGVAAAGGTGTNEDEKPEDSAFAKFNVKVQVPSYTDEHYQSHLQHADWTKEETDYLMELAREFDLRWTIIWDRYEFVPKALKQEQEGETNGETSTAVVPAPRQRTMEELKARYYEVAAKMMAVHKPAQYMTAPEFELYEMMQNFNPEQERRRKEFALNTMSRSRDEAREEESLLLEIKRILARTERFNEERRELYHRLDYPSTDADINSFKSSAGLQALLQNLMSSDKAKKRRSIMPGDGVSPGGVVPASATSETAPSGPGGGGGGGHNRRESIAATSSHSRRESESTRGAPATPAEPTPTSATASGTNASNKKKSTAQQPERRKLSPQEEQIYGVSYHDRLGSGPTFRYEKINKLYSHKSGQQQLRITNALAELDVPARLVMPTAAVTAQFEILWGAVTALVDLRKVSDKLDAEIKVEMAKKAERERQKALERGETGEDGGKKEEGQGEKKKDGQGQGEGEKKEGEEKDKTVASTSAAGSASAPSSEAPNGAGASASEESKPAAGSEAQQQQQQQQQQQKEKEKEIKQEPGSDSASAATSGIEEKPQPGSSGGTSIGTGGGGGGGDGTAHKRSASVISAGSDKSAKRVKK